jgi:hypothetical protein
MYLETRPVALLEAFLSLAWVRVLDEELTVAQLAK